MKLSCQQEKIYRVDFFTYIFILFFIFLLFFYSYLLLIYYFVQNIFLFYYYYFVQNLRYKVSYSIFAVYDLIWFFKIVVVFLILFWFLFIYFYFILFIYYYYFVQNIILFYFIIILILIKIWDTKHRTPCLLCMTWFEFLKLLLCFLEKCLYVYYVLIWLQ